jgi:hypothetical protein
MALAEVRVDASHVARLGFNLADRPMLGAGRSRDREFSLEIDALAVVPDGLA